MTPSPHPLQSASFRPALQMLLLAGLAGGLAEVVWVALYSQFAPLGAAQVSRQIVASVIPALADGAFAPALGVAIHLTLSVLLAMLLAILLSLSTGLPWTKKPSPQWIVLISASALMLVWAINFLIVLPHLNPAFVLLLPYPVTFFSKLLFGLAAGLCLSRSGANPHPQHHPQDHHEALP